MDISELQRIYAGHPNTKGLAALLEDSSVRTIFLGGLYACLLYTSPSPRD